VRGGQLTCDNTSVLKPKVAGLAKPGFMLDDTIPGVQRKELREVPAKQSTGLPSISRAGRHQYYTVYSHQSRSHGQVCHPSNITTHILQYGA
jgi:hypothetical protein